MSTIPKAGSHHVKLSTVNENNMAKKKEKTKVIPEKAVAGRPLNCKCCRHPKTQCTCGRPTVMTEEVIKKLEYAFSQGCTDGEACLLANISRASLGKYCAENAEFADRKAILKENPMLKARMTIIKSLDEVEHAKWFAERKMKGEFAPRQERTGSDGKPLFNYSEEPQKRMKKYL